MNNRTAHGNFFRVPPLLVLSDPSSILGKLEKLNDSLCSATNMRWWISHNFWGETPLESLGAADVRGSKVSCALSCHPNKDANNHSMSEVSILSCFCSVFQWQFLFQRHVMVISWLEGSKSMQIIPYSILGRKNLFLDQLPDSLDT